MTIFRGVALLVTDGLPVPSFNTAAELPRALIWLGGGDIAGSSERSVALVACLLGCTCSVIRPSGP